MNAAWLLLLFYGLVFIATVLLVEGAAGFLRGAWRERQRVNRRIGLLPPKPAPAETRSLLRQASGSTANLPGPAARWHRRTGRVLAQAGVAMPAGRFFLLMAFLALGCMGCALAFAFLMAGHLSPGGIFLCLLFAAGLGLGAPLAVLGQLRDRRVKNLEEQFPLALDVLVRGLRAGHPVTAALALLAEELPDPIGREFAMAHDETAYGLELRDALENMAVRCGVPDMHMFAVCISVQHETGGNLAEILENLARVIRDRATMVLKVRALSSEGRMTAAMLTALPVFAFVALFLLNPAFYLDVAGDPAFFPAVLVLLALYGVGVVSIRRLTHLKI